MKQNKNIMQEESPLLKQKIGRLLMSYSIPAIIAIMVNAIYNITDQIYIGHGVGYLGNAATTVTYPIMSVIIAIASLLGAGGTTYAAVKLGEKNKEEAELVLNNLISIILCIGIIITVVGLIFLKPILRMCGGVTDVMPYAVDYGTIILLGAPFNMLAVALSGLTRVDGNPRISMYGMIIGAILNIILDSIYMFVFHWGIKGIALGTITSQILNAALLIYYFTKRAHVIHINFSKMKIVPKLCKEILKLGSSTGIAQLVPIIMLIVMNNSLIYYGNKSVVTAGVALGAMGIVMKFMMILAAICMGLGIGALPIIGFNFGAKRYDRIIETFYKASLAATVSISIGWVLCQTIPDVLVQLFGGGDVEFMNFAIKCIRIYLGGIFCVGFEIIATNYYQATKQVLKASVLSMFRQFIILVPLILVLPIFMGLDGILYAGLVSDIITAVIIACFIVPEMRKLKKNMEDSGISAFSENLDVD